MGSFFSFLLTFVDVMKKKIFLYLILGMIGVVVAFVHYYSVNPCYKPANRMYGLTVCHHNDDTLRIAYIGDSWAYHHQEIPTIMDSLITVDTSLPVLIRNAGIGGLVSKEIYYKLFEDKLFRDIIEWGPDFCFVSAGINDTNKKSGCSNYKENMRIIISSLLDMNITPVILEIPYYDIWYTFRQMNIITMLRSVRSMIWTCSAMNCIDDYSNALEDLVEEQQWQNDIIIVRRQYWNPLGYKGQKELYTKDRIHINQAGYYQLDSCIASEIVTFLMKK